MYRVESDFEYKGYRCVTTFSDLGHRCGYVGLPEDHPLYKVDYSDKINVTFDSIEGTPIGKRSPIALFLCTGIESKDRITPELFFNVHGGLTYSGGGKGSDYPVSSDLWWLGFDCAHAGDRQDYKKMVEYFGLNARPKHFLEVDAMFSPHDGDVIRSVEYVQSECRSLVDQIIEYCDKHCSVV